MARLWPCFPWLPHGKQLARSVPKPLFRGSLAETSGGLAPADAGSELLKALFQAILNDLHCLAGRLRCGCRALLRSLDGYFEHFPRKLGLHREVFLNLAERLVFTGQVRCFP